MNLNKQILTRIKSAIKNGMPWKRQESLSDAPTWLVVTIGVPCTLLWLFFLSGLHRVLPSYLKAVDTTPISNWGILGWAITAVVAIMAILTWHYGCITWRCNKILCDRWYM